MGEIDVLHIPEWNMVADPFTKYLPVSVWRRHMHYLLNRPGPLPPRAVKGKSEAMDLREAYEQVPLTEKQVSFMNPLADRVQT